MVGQPRRNSAKMVSWSRVSEHLVNIIGMSDQLKWNNQLSYYLPVYIIFSTRYLSYLVNPKGQLIHILNIIAVLNLYFFIQVCHLNHIVIPVLCLIITMIETGAMMMIPVFNNISEYFDQLISLFSVGFILVEMKVEFWLTAVILIVLFVSLVKSIKKQKM